MDRRQKKTREAIFNAFCDLLSKKHYDKITVAEIIEAADIGRATFYAHFETKDFLLKALCEELFCHIFDAESGEVSVHKHIFECEAPPHLLLHLLEHLERNDRNILRLLTCENNELFLKYFKENLKNLIEKNAPVFASDKSRNLPQDFWLNHIASSFVECVRWWIESGFEKSPKEILTYFEVLIK